MIRAMQGSDRPPIWICYMEGIGEVTATLDGLYVDGLLATKEQMEAISNWMSEQRERVKERMR